MRNLKKILALALALIMSMSLMVTANAFTDDADIDPTFDEAVTVLSNLEVFQGYPNGSFQPEGSITRAEVAAIIYRIVTGDVDDTQVGIYADYPKFDDVKAGSWYAGYVNYCANAEYIKGYDAKTFGPNDPVTGYQALAMILRAVGYDKNGEFTGSGWQVQTAAVGKQLHITDNVTTGMLNQAASREVVAEILFRSILVPQVTYSAAFGYQSIGITTGAITGNNAWASAWLVDNASIGAETFGLELTSGEISAVGRTAGTTTLVDRSTAANGTALNPVTVTNTSTPWTDIGYGAYVYTIPTSGVKTREAVSDVVITGESLKITTDGTEYSDAGVSIEDGAHLYYNGEYIGNILVNASGVITNNPGLAVDQYLMQKDGLRGVKVDYIDNDNGGRAEVVVVTEYTTAQVMAVTSENSTTGLNGDYGTRVYFQNGGSAINPQPGSAFSVLNTSLVTNDELAVGDWVTYVEYPNSRTSTVAGDFYVTEAPATSASYTARIIAAGAETIYTIGGTNYYISDLEYITDDKDDNGAASYYLADSIRQSKDVTIYTDPYGYIVYADETVAVYNYLYVISNAATNPNTGLTEAVVALADGTISTVQIANQITVGNTNPTYYYAANALVGMYTYYTTDAGYYVLVDPQSEMTSAKYTNGTATISGYATNGSATQRAVNLSTVVVDLRNYTVGTTSVPVYTGYSEIPTVQRTTIWVNIGDVNSPVIVGFLLNNANTITQNFIVYQTTEYRQIVSGLNNQTRSYTMDVLEGDTVSEDFALTISQFSDIQKYGVGIYSFISNDGGNSYTLVEYTSFDEVWGDASWGTGVVTWNGSNYTYGTQNLVVIDVANRRVTNDLGLVWGRTTKAYVVNDGVAANIVYAILGTEAPATGTGVTHPTQHKDAATYTYDVATGYITMNRNQIVPDASYTITVNGAVWKSAVAGGTTIDLPDAAIGGNVGTGMCVTMGKDVFYKAYSDKLEVTSDVNILTGYVAWTLKDGQPVLGADGNVSYVDLTVPVKFATTGKVLNDVFTNIEGEYSAYNKPGSKTEGYVDNDSNVINDTTPLWPNEDATFVDGYYMVDAKNVGTGYEVVVNGTVEDADIFFVQADAVINVRVAGTTQIVDSYGADGDISDNITISNPDPSSN